jgi:Tfp pilus assembly protein PilV
MKWSPANPKHTSPLRKQGTPRSRVGLVWQGRRAGLSLLEVLVALGIFVVALTVLGRLITLGGELALEAQWRNEAAQLCQTKLAEVRAGAEPLMAQSDMPFDESTAWRWGLECEPSNAVPNLWQVRVRVSRVPPGKPLEVSLSQWLLDPRSRGSVFDQAGSDSTGPSPASTNSAGGTGTGGK